MNDIVKKYLDNSKTSNHRYRSWNHCFEAFQESNDTKLLSLHLGFYLASWGMYRGSSKLLQNDYLVHEGAVRIILDNMNIQCSEKKEVCYGNIEKILFTIKVLNEHYDNSGVSPTGTLISKVLLGTLGCLPAYDRFFIIGAINKKVLASSINKNSLISLFNFIKLHENEIQNIQSKLLKTTNYYYPIMKIVDMYFWQLGFDLNSKKKV